MSRYFTRLAERAGVAPATPAHAHPTAPGAEALPPALEHGVEIHLPNATPAATGGESRSLPSADPRGPAASRAASMPPPAAAAASSGRVGAELIPSTPRAVKPARRAPDAATRAPFPAAGTVPAAATPATDAPSANTVPRIAEHRTPETASPTEHEAADSRHSAVHPVVSPASGARVEPERSEPAPMPGSRRLSQATSVAAVASRVAARDTPATGPGPATGEAGERGVDVRIGTVTVEFRAPPAPSPAPAPRRAAAPATSSATRRFSPNRHYLRWE